jgi:two-component system, NtrC family, nitrogen regulation sensor histidine kinase NtrY
MRQRWQRRLDITLYRSRRFMPVIEVATLVIVLGIGISTYLAISGSSSTKPLGLFTTAVLLVANLVPAVAMLVLFGRRMAQKRSAQSPLGGRGRLHVRLVAIFSLIAAVPMLLMVVFASLLFQYGVEFWYSDRARGMLENANSIAVASYAEKEQRVIAESKAMSSDIRGLLSRMQIDDQPFLAEFYNQLFIRELSEGAIISITPKNGVQSLVLVNPYERKTDNWIPPQTAKQLLAGTGPVFKDSGERMEVVTPLPDSKELFLYTAKVADPKALQQARRASLVLKDYQALVSRSRALQLRFNVALYIVTLLIVGVAVLIALNVADRLVRPVGELVAAARRVAAGDLSARVPSPKTRDEVGTLTNAFNRMTGRLGQQTQELVKTNELLDRRRALTEAVLAGVSAGVIAVDGTKSVRIINQSACTLLKVERETAVGTPLNTVSPELGAMLDGDTLEALTQIVAGSEARSLAVKIVKDEVGHVLTFDDMTQQLIDQRRAAWSDVARRVAHEIKNPLTPIQLAAERLKRRFSKEITSDPALFERLTDTIGRQVGDLRRMVDEFSSFARMPKPVFEDESLVDVAREALFLHEVANPGIQFHFDAPDPQPRLVCDRRQLAQALSNIIKNGVEAIQQTIPGAGVSPGIITLTMIQSPRCITVTVADNGIGLPVERDRIIEPYMTTRAGGTGLGLAIVKKIVEEHLSQISFADHDGGGTIVTLVFDTEKLASLIQSDPGTIVGAQSDVPSALTRPSELTRSIEPTGKEQAANGT